MDHSITDELYSETLKLSNGQAGPMSSSNHNQTDLYDHELDDLCHGDASLWGSSTEEHNDLSDLEREWQRRHDQFHTVGYRDGLTVGKEASAQEGFNIGFKESVLVGYSWGLVRGVTSALTCLPAGLREKLVEAQEEREKFQRLHESARSLSTTDALKLFHDDILTERSAEQSGSAEGSLEMGASQDQSSSPLQKYSGELKSLVLKSPAIKVNLAIDH